ncbi:Uncharacterised protein [Buttiauxella agrestis]|uniref:SGNH hydrolase-type esterase domain-containing protein n=1 Tax=Buttiauxella agrestis TaxID=82977 RepID=A0A381C924_9ENTR|nr:GDSL-type esterase/lipase family protein [Buttiauxella agrestis]SUW64327.1 Uncharacterised protein [Buttiauxella agrestis]
MKIFLTAFLLATAFSASADIKTAFIGDESRLGTFGVVNFTHKMKLSQIDKKSDTILMFGDSIMQGLNYNGLHFDHVTLGIVGDTVYGIKKRIEETDIENYKAVFVEAGTNNLLMGELGIPLGMEMADLIDYAAPKAKILYVSETIVSNRVAYKHIDESFNNADYLIKKQCAKYKNCVVVPLPSEFIGKDGMDPKYTLDDHVHLNATGYLLWKKQLNKALSPFPYSIYYKYIN